MRVLIFSQYFWPENFRINDVAKALYDKGNNVDVLTGKPNYPHGKIFGGYKSLGCQVETHDGVLIHRIPLSARGCGAMRLTLNYISFVISGLLFSPWVLYRRKFDVIFVYAPSPILQAIPAIFFGWLKGCPVVIWVQDLWPESLSATGYIKNKYVLKLVEYVVRLIYRHADLLLVQSKAFEEPVIALASDTPVKYYPNSVDEVFCMTGTVSTPDFSGLVGKFSVMFAGNVGSAQAVEVIIETASLLREYIDINFIVLGEGSRRDWMLQETKNRGLPNLYLPGQFSVESMPGLMQKASALLVTLADHEILRLTIPSKVQAYLAAGRPILACLNGEGAVLVEASGAGLTVPAENAQALAEAVLQLYRMPEQERDAMGAKGRLYYEQHFSHDILMSQLINHFQSVVKIKEKIQ